MHIYRPNLKTVLAVTIISFVSLTIAAYSASLPTTNYINLPELSEGQDSIFTSSKGNNANRELGLKQTTRALSRLTEGRDYVPGQVVIKWRTSKDSAAAKALIAAEKLIPVKTKNNFGYQVYNVNGLSRANTKPGVMPTLEARAKLKPGNDNMAALLAKLYQNPEVELAEPNYIIQKQEVGPSDSLFGKQWYLYNVGQTGGAVDVDIDWLEAMQYTTLDSNIIIAVIDDGADLTHPDLINQQARDANGNPIAYNFVEDSTTIYPGEHGTQVASAALAQGNNGEGVTGVCPKCKLMPLQISYLSSAEVANAINYARVHNAHIINMSFHAPASLAVNNEAKLAAQADIIMTLAAGNTNSRDINHLAPTNLLEVFSVGATTNQGTKAGYSSYGYRVDVSAPVGESDNMFLQDCAHTISGFLAAGANGAKGCVFTSGTTGATYATTAGTSFAAPQVAGLAGLIKSHNPTWSSKQILSLIASTTTPIEGDKLGFMGTGNINVYNAFTQTNNMNTQRVRYGGYKLLDPVTLLDEARFEYGKSYQFYPVIKNISGTTTGFKLRVKASNPCINLTQIEYRLPTITSWTNYQVHTPINLTISNCTNKTASIPITFEIINANNRVISTVVDEIYAKADVSTEALTLSWPQTMAAGSTFKVNMRLRNAGTNPTQRVDLVLRPTVIDSAYNEKTFDFTVVTHSGMNGCAQLTSDLPGESVIKPMLKCTVNSLAVGEQRDIEIQFSLNNPTQFANHNLSVLLEASQVDHFVNEVNYNNHQSVWVSTQLQ
jgi:subtilisin family serine protease